MNDSSDSEFDFKNTALYRVKKDSIELERFGEISIRAILNIIPDVKIGELILAVNGLLENNHSDSEVAQEVSVLITREGAYVIKPSGQLYEEVIDGYNFGFLPVITAKAVIKAVLDGEPDPSYLKYDSQSIKSDTDSYPFPPCYT